MSENPVLVATEPSGLATITLNRPAAMNALTKAMRTELAGAFDGLAADGSTRVVILTGAGRAFCAGLDLKEVGQVGLQSSSTSPVADSAASDPIQAMGRFKGPIIGAINGAAITGGLELALACDLLIASRAARFADTHARVGVMPGWGLSQRLSRAIGVGRAKELSLTGNFLAAEEAERWGLVNRVVAPEALMGEARRIAGDMLSVIPEMLLAYKKVIDDGYATTLADGLSIEAERARAANAAVSPAEVERRRAAIQARGKSQAGKG